MNTVDVYAYVDTENYSDEPCLSIESARDFAQDVATQAINTYIDMTTPKTQGTPQMQNTAVSEVTNAVIQETTLNAKLIAGERLYENIETLVDKFILSKLSFWQKLTMSSKQKRLITLIGVYTIIHAIKSGGFGLTKFRINHAAIEYVTIACNKEIQKELFGGFDTNIVASLFKMPTVTTVGA